MSMTTIDLVAAQQRVEERQRAKIAVQRARLDSRRIEQASNPLNKLPFGIGRRSLDIWDAIRGREGTRPAFRVGQVDAEMLDEELLELLRGQVGEGFKYFGARRLVY